MGFSTMSAEICGEAITGTGDADTSETGRDPAPLVVGIGGGGGGRQLVTDVNKWQLEEVTEGPASTDNEEDGA